MVAWRYRISLLVFNLISHFVCCVHWRDIKLNTQVKIPYVYAPVCYSPYPLDNSIGFDHSTYPVDSDLSAGLLSPTFEQLRPGP